MKSEEDQQAAICCRKEVKRVQCSQCNGYENEDDVALLCTDCQNKAERYDRLLMALRSIWTGTNEDHIRKTVEAALKFFGEKP